MTVVSVIMPAYNVGALIADGIDSVLAQQSADFELLIADDASTDHTAEIIDAYRHHPRVRTFRNQHNRGAAATRNMLLGEARGRYITPCDADDVMLTGNLARQIEYLDTHADIGAVYASVIAVWIDAAGRLTQGPELVGRDSNRVWDLRENVINHGGSMMHADLVARVGGYEEDVPLVDDWSLWLKLAEITRIHFLEGEALYLWRRRPGTLSGTHPARALQTEQIVRAAAQRRGARPST